MKRKLLLFFIPLIFGSCSKWIAPPYTSVDKMLKVEKEMTSQKVDETLGIKPYNLLHRNDSTAIFEYHYRLKDRAVNNIINYKKYIHLVQSQNGGKNWYDKPSKFYILYENDRLTSLITENGLENSDYLLLKNNNLMLVSQSDLIEFDLWENASYLHKIDKTQKLQPAKTIRQSFLYSTNLPDGIIGFKYAVSGKAGGYISGTYSLDYEEISFLTGGFIVRASPIANIYAGAGFYFFDSLALETGTLLYLKKLALDFGFGFTFEEGLYGKLGFGFNF